MTETSQQNSGSIQVASVSQPNPTEYDNSLGKHVFKDFAEDQKAIWTSPLHVRLVDADWLVTGNTRHFPPSHGQTRTVTGRRFLDILTESGSPQ